MIKLTMMIVTGKEMGKKENKIQNYIRSEEKDQR